MFFFGSMSDQRRLRQLEKGLDRLSRLWRLPPAGYAPPPLFAYLLLTYECNQNCSFCVQRLRRRERPPIYMEPDFFTRLLAQWPASTFLSFSGGEPLLHPRLPEILAAAGRSHRLSLVTNGLLLDEAMCRALVHCGAPGFGRPGLSVLGISVLESARELRRPPQAFEERAATLELLRREKVKAGRRWPAIDLKVVIRRDNLHLLNHLREFIRRGLADTITYQVPYNLVYAAYYEGQSGLWPQPNDLNNRLGGVDDYVTDASLLADQLRELLTCPERRAGHIRFYPAAMADDLWRLALNRPVRGNYFCVFPWTSVMVSPNGSAFLCRLAEGESLLTQPFGRAWNSAGFRAFRKRIRQEDVGRVCAGCCFLLPAAGRSE